MRLAETFRKFFGKEKRKSNSAMTMTLIEQINSSMGLLVQKAGNLNDSFAEEKLELEKISQETEKFVELDDIFSAKLEQDILGRITAASSACDKALVGKDTGTVKKTISALKATVSQRTFVLNRNA